MKQFLLLTTLTCLFACHSKTAENLADSTKVTGADTTHSNYLPVALYLQAEMAMVDSFPYKIMRYETANDKTDSGIITTIVFDRIAAEFLVPELDSSLFVKKFTENSFVDRSTGGASFTYSTKDAGLGLRRVDVLLQPSPNGTERLSSVYMESAAGGKDSIEISKMFWKAGRNFSILKLRRGKGPEQITQTRVVWDPGE